MASASWEEEKQLRLSLGWLNPHSFSEFDEGTRLVGQRVFVAGHGEGVVRAFRKHLSGASPHEIHFKEGVKEVKLRRKGNTETPWLLGPHVYNSLGTEWGDDVCVLTLEVALRDGSSFVLRAREVESVQSLKLQIEAERAIPVGQQRLFLSGAGKRRNSPNDIIWGVFLGRVCVCVGGACGDVVCVGSGGGDEQWAADAGCCVHRVGRRRTHAAVLSRH